MTDGRPPRRLRWRSGEPSASSRRTPGPAGRSTTHERTGSAVEASGQVLEAAVDTVTLAGGHPCSSSTKAPRIVLEASALSVIRTVLYR
jgi:hypothetical protein